MQLFSLVSLSLSLVKKGVFQIVGFIPFGVVCPLVFTFVQGRSSKARSAEAAERETKKRKNASNQSENFLRAFLASRLGAHSFSLSPPQSTPFRRSKSLSVKRGPSS